MKFIEKMLIVLLLRKKNKLHYKLFFNRKRFLANFFKSETTLIWLKTQTKQIGGSFAYVRAILATKTNF